MPPVSPPAAPVAVAPKPPAGPPLAARLTCRIRPGLTETFKIKGAEYVLGRESGIAVEGVSRRHAVIRCEAGQYWIEGTSPAGTFVNGRLAVREKLRNLDVITLGRSVDLVFLLQGPDDKPVKTRGISYAALVPTQGDPTPIEIPIGQLTLGRSSSGNNVVVDNGAVSKLHTRLERTGRQLLMQDLNSSNGTFVNGRRLTTAQLQHGDVLTLAEVAVAAFRVVIESGEIESGLFEALAPEPAAPVAETPSGAIKGQVSNDWKTVYEWDSKEMRGLAALREEIAQQQQERRGAKRPAAKPMADSSGRTVKKDAKPPADLPPPPRPAPGAAPAAPAPAKAAPTTPAPAKAAPIAPPAATAAPAAVTPPTPEATPEKPAPRLIKEVRLEMGTTKLVVATPGSFELGRSRDLALRIEHATVSRRHACLTLSPGRDRVSVRHTQGSNPTAVNGVPLSGDAEKVLVDGDTVEIGEVKLAVSLVWE